MEWFKQKGSKSINVKNSNKCEQTHAKGNQNNKKDIEDFIQEVYFKETKFNINGDSDLANFPNCSNSFSGQEKSMLMTNIVHTNDDKGNKKTKGKIESIPRILKSVGKALEDNGREHAKPKKKKKEDLKDSAIVEMINNTFKGSKETNKKEQYFTNHCEEEGNIDRNMPRIDEKVVVKKRKRFSSEVKTGVVNVKYTVLKKNSASVDLINSTNYEYSSGVHTKSSFTNCPQKKKMKPNISKKKAVLHSSKMKITESHKVNLLQEKRNPLCVEMQRKDYIPPRLFDKPDLLINSDLVGSGNELNWSKLSHMNTVGTGKWEVKIGEIASEECENDSEKKNFNEFEEEIISSQNELRSDLYKFIPVSNISMILALPPGHSLFLKGILKFKVLVGSLQVLGYEMNDENNEVQTIFSLRKFSLLNIQHSNNLKYTKEQYWKLVQNIGEQYLDNNSAISELSENNMVTFTSLILLECVSSSLISFLQKYYPSYFFPFITRNNKMYNQVAICLKAEFSDQFESCLHVNNEWNLIEESLMNSNSGQLKCIPFGSKSVGKSTFLRYIINRMLPKVKKVLYIDLDPGQCEFTFPGCVSATVVDKPLLGPSIAHLTEPARCVYLGEVNVKNCIVTYMESVKYIFDWCSSQEHLAGIPWFINTMGFAEGVGVDLAIYIIKLFDPSHVVQIFGVSACTNFPFLLESEIVNDAKTERISFEINPVLNYSFFNFQSGAEQQNEGKLPRSIPANLLREFAVIAYFSSIVSPPAYSLLQVKPHVLPFSHVKLCVCNEKINYSDYLNAMNANTVALCNVGSKKGLMPSEPGFPEIWDKPPLGPCYGMGIVRGVDMKLRVIFLITPLNMVKLEHVNCLVLGAIKTPSVMFINQDEAVGEIPYVVEGNKNLLDQNVKLN